MDEDEKRENMCPQCREELEKKHCIRCGKTIEDNDHDSFVNPNFDTDRFDKLSGKEDDVNITKVSPLK